MKFFEKAIMIGMGVGILSLPILVGAVTFGIALLYSAPLVLASFLGLAVTLIALNVTSAIIKGCCKGDAHAPEPIPAVRTSNAHRAVHRQAPANAIQRHQQPVHIAKPRENRSSVYQMNPDTLGKEMEEYVPRQRMRN